MMTDTVRVEGLAWIARLMRGIAESRRPVAIEPGAAALFAASLEDAIDRLDEVEHLEESAGRYHDELRIARAERDQALQRIEVLLYASAQTRRPPRIVDGGAVVIDLCGIFAREQTFAGRPGGDAA